MCIHTHSFTHTSLNYVTIYTLSLSQSCTHVCTYTLSLMNTCMDTQTHTYTHTHSHSLTHSFLLTVTNLRPISQLSGITVSPKPLYIQ